QRKVAIKSVDGPEYNIRMSLAVERTKLSDADIQSVHDVQGNPIRFVKLRVRDSFKLGNDVRVDISSFRSGDTMNDLESNPLQHDCEIEMIRLTGDPEPAYKDFMSFIHQLLRIVQYDPFTTLPSQRIEANLYLPPIYLLTHGDVSRCLKDYCTLVPPRLLLRNTGSVSNPNPNGNGNGSRRLSCSSGGPITHLPFMGVQPHTLTSTKFNPDTQYAITPKVDG